MSVFSGVLDGNIVYLGFSDFLFYGYEGTGDDVELALQNYQDLLDNYPDVQGVIIDVRSNGGGYNRDLNQVLGKLVPQNHTAFYSRQKNGIGRLDYAPWVPEEIKWQERTRELQVPVVVLADVNSVSMAEMTAMAVLSLPNGAVIGERTFGGNGSLAPANEYFDMTYSGFFENDVMWIYTTNTMSRDVNGVTTRKAGLKALTCNWNGLCHTSATENNRRTLAYQKFFLPLSRFGQCKASLCAEKGIRCESGAVPATVSLIAWKSFLRHCPSGWEGSFSGASQETCQAVTDNYAPPGQRSHY